MASAYLSNDIVDIDKKTKEMEVIKNYLDFVAKNKEKDINLLNIWKS